MLPARTRSSLHQPAGEGPSTSSSSLQPQHRRLRSQQPGSRRPVVCKVQPSKEPNDWNRNTAQQEPWRASQYDYPPPPSSGRGGGAPGPPPPPPPTENGNGPKDSLTRALVAAAFITGVGAGVYFDSNITLSPTNVASTEILDRQTPSSEVCMAYGYSAMALDQRLFVSFNPFNVYVTQPEVKPGCILRRANIGLLENKKLINPTQVETCKRSMNTFAFVGELETNPEVSCVYHSEEAENQYLANPKARFATPAGTTVDPAAAAAQQMQQMQQQPGNP